MSARLLALAVLLVACEPADEGWHVADDGTALHPGVLPMTVGDDGIDDATLLPEAVAWWGDQLGAQPWLIAYPGSVVVSVGLVPWDGEGAEPAGIARLDYDESGAVLGGEIVLSSDIAYDRPTLLQALRHELGHVLGLADDCGPPACVDLRSVMASPLDPLGEVTAHDRALLAPYLEGL